MNIQEQREKMQKKAQRRAEFLTNQRNEKIKAEKLEHTLFQQVNRLSQMIAEKAQELEENRKGWYDSDFLGEVGRDLVEDFERDLSKLGEMAANLDEISHNLQKHEMTLENIFDL